MPYINKSDRKLFDFVDIFRDMLNDYEIREGDLNYIITRLCHAWLSSKKLRYNRINTAIGVLECAKLELYRQVAVPYEDAKKAENGSVSDLDGGTEDEVVSK